MRSWLLAGTIAGAVALAAAPAGAWCRTTTRRPAQPGDCSDSGIPLAWPSVCAGFSLHVSGPPDDIPLADYRLEAAHAARRWFNVPCDDNGTTQPYFQLLPASDTAMRSGFDRNGPNANTLSFNPVWTLDAQHRLGTIAVTLVSFDRATGQILDADMEFNQRSDQNPEGFHFTLGVPGDDDVDLVTIMTHEFGHFQGIGHSEVELAVMWPQAGAGERRRDLRSDDAAAICDAYPPGNAPDGPCDLTPRGGFAGDADVPGAGCACRTPGAPAPAPARGRRGVAGVLLAGCAVLAARRRRPVGRGAAGRRSSRAW